MGCWRNCKLREKEVDYVPAHTTYVSKYFCWSVGHVLWRYLDLYAEVDRGAGGAVADTVCWQWTPGRMLSYPPSAPFR